MLICLNTHSKSREYPLTHLSRRNLYFYINRSIYE
nr:MAG TPA: hypothetical protein [Caudoviricetes sp.]